MDEIEVLKKIKKIVKQINIVIIFFISSIAIISYLIFPSKSANFTSIALIIIAMIIMIFNSASYLVIIIFYKLSYKKLDFSNINKEYYRDICNLYAPAIVSLLYNMKNEIYRDYTATILNLNIKKYIKIINFDSDVKIYKGENLDLSKLNLHEQFAYKCIINNLKFNEEEFKNEILKDAERNKLLIKENFNFVELLKLLSISIVYIIFLILSIFNNEPEVMSVMLLVLIIPAIAYGKDIYKDLTKKIMNKYVFTTKAKKEIKKIKKLKNFIRDYTQINEKGIAHVQVLEEYIPYALSLGEAHKVEEYIKENQIYRKLIYKNDSL